MNSGSTIQPTDEDRGQAIQSAVAGCLDAVERCRAAALALDAESFSRRVPGSDSIGAHLRHCIEHLQAIREGAETGVVDYDARARNQRLQEDQGYFLDELAALEHFLRGLNDEEAAGELRFCGLAGGDGQRIECQTSIVRELVFASSHTIHHLALTRLLAERLGRPFPNAIDVAFSTASHRRTAEAKA